MISASASVTSNSNPNQDTSNWTRNKNIVIGGICAFSAVYSHVILEHEQLVSIKKAFLEDHEVKPLKYFFAHLWLWLVFLTSTLSTLRNS